MRGREPHLQAQPEGAHTPHPHTYVTNLSTGAKPVLESTTRQLGQFILTPTRLCSKLEH